MKPFETSRIYDAPREKVWRAWTEAERLKQWWGPAGAKVHTCEVDLRPGGRFHYGMTMPDGTGIWGRFRYLEIDAPGRLVCIVSFSDPGGGVTRHPWSPHWPLEIHSTMLLEEQGARKTRVTVRWMPAEGSSEIERSTFEEGRDSMKQGWGGTLDKLTENLSK